jgi:hypothetical protein
MHKLSELEFVVGHDRVRLYGSLDQFDRLDDRGIVILGLLTRVEIGHIRIGSAGNGCINSPGQVRRSATGCSRGVRGSGACGCEFGYQLVGVRHDDREGANPLA